MFYAPFVRRTAWFLAAAAATSSFAVAPAGIASPGLTTGRSCAYSNTPATEATTNQLRHAVICLINRERVHRRLPPLRDSRQLARAAQEHTNAMVRNGSFAHATADSTPSSRVDATGYRSSSVGENIAAGFSTPAEVVRAWMASADHCANILDPSYRNIGVGESPHSVRGTSAGPAAWTTDFALGAGQAPPSRNTAPAAGCPY
jgi:uncharacterized protein YkwD